MQILVITGNPESSLYIKDTLESFGKGMKIKIMDVPLLIEKRWSCIISTIKDYDLKQSSDLIKLFDEPKNETDYQALNKELWKLYRDFLRDMIGDKCSCGLYDFCHCH